MPVARRFSSVEDNAVNAFISTASLESMGISSVHAANGLEAVNLFRKHRFDAVLMDCEMPVMDGFAGDAPNSRSRSPMLERTRTPIIALTANALERGPRQAVSRKGWTTTSASQSSFES